MNNIRKIISLIMFVFLFSVNITYGVVVPNGDMETTDPRGLALWSWNASEGGIGGFLGSTSPVHGGNRSFLVSHKNAMGYTELVSDFISVQPGTWYTVSAWCYPVEKIRRGMYLMVSQYATGNDNPQYPNDFSPTTQAFGSGQWQPISVPVQVRTGNTRIRIHCIQSSLQSDVYWDDFTVTVVGAQTYNPPAQESLPDLATAQAIVAQRPRAVVQIAQQNGRPRLSLDGNSTPWTFYVGPPSNPTNAQIADFRNAGVRVYLVPLALGKDGGVWRGYHNWVFSEVDDLLWRVLRVDPQGYVIFYLYCDPYAGWGVENPNHVTQDQDGLKVIVNNGRPARWGGTPVSPERFGPSLVSQTLRTDISETLQQLTQYIEQSTAGRAVIGYHIGGGSDGQWYQWTETFPGSELGHWGDYCPGAQDSFRTWLNTLYGGNVAALRQAWNSPSLTFTTATVPSPARYSSISGTIASPATHQDVIDHTKFYSEGVAETIIALAKALKDSTPRRIICGTYYEDITCIASSHTALGRLLADSYLDYMSGPAAYDIRMPGFQSAVRSVFGSTLIHGKTYLTEQDWRSLQSEPNNPAENFSWGRAETSEQHNAMVRRECGMMLAFGLGTWWYDMTGGWYRDDQIMSGIEEAHSAFNCDLGITETPAADVAVFVSEEGSACVAPGSFTPFRRSILDQIQELNTAGIPYRLYLQSDLGRITLPEHKLYLFLNPYKVSSVERAAIEQLKSNGKTLVFLHAPGTAVDTNDANIKVNNSSFDYPTYPAYSLPEWQSQADIFFANDWDGSPDGKSAALANGWARQLDLGTVQGGRTYRLSFQSAITGGSPVLLARVLDQMVDGIPGVALQGGGTAEWTPSLSGTWTTYTYTFTVAPSANGHRVGVLFSAGGTGYAGIDNVKFDCNMVNNSSFDYPAYPAYSLPEWQSQADIFFANNWDGSPDGKSAALENGWARQLNLATVQGGRTYRLSFQSAITGGSPVLLARVLDQMVDGIPGVALQGGGTAEWTPSLSGTWTNYTYTFTVAPSADGHTVGVLFFAAGVGYAGIDNVNLTLVETSGETITSLTGMQVSQISDTALNLEPNAVAVTVPNSGMESTPILWSWSKSGGATGTFGSYTQKFYEGSKSFKVSHTNNVGYTEFVSDFITVEPGKWYMVSGWCYPVGNIQSGTYLMVSQYAPGNNTPQLPNAFGSTTQPFNGGQWQPISVPAIQIRTGNTRIRIHCIQTLLASTIYWDTFSVKNIPHPLLDGIDMLTLPSTITNPAYGVVDQAAVPLAHYAGGQATGAAIRDFGSWKSVFVGGTGLSASFLSKLAQDSGCWCVSEPGDAVYANQNFLTIHAMFTGHKKLTLARASQVVDLTSGQIVSANTTTLELDMDRGTTRWFALNPVP